MRTLRKTIVVTLVGVAFTLFFAFIALDPRGRVGAACTVGTDFKYAVARELIEENPCKRLSRKDLIGAKVHRDRMISQWDPVFPVYGLASNKGYSTPKHLAALREHGPSPLHRQSFAPVWNAPVPQEMLEFMLQDEEVPAEQTA